MGDPPHQNEGVSNEENVSPSVTRGRHTITERIREGHDIRMTKEYRSPEKQRVKCPHL